MAWAVNSFGIVSRMCAGWSFHWDAEDTCGVTGPTARTKAAALAPIPHPPKMVLEESLLTVTSTNHREKPSRDVY